MEYTSSYHMHTHTCTHTTHTHTHTHTNQKRESLCHIDAHINPMKHWDAWTLIGRPEPVLENPPWRACRCGCTMPQGHH